MFPKQCWPFLDGLKPKSLLVDLNWIFLIFQTGDNVQCNIYIYIYVCICVKCHAVKHSLSRLVFSILVTMQ